MAGRVRKRRYGSEPGRESSPGEAPRRPAHAIRHAEEGNAGQR
jgi:hypothetical protein